jgi:hypothetical protein
MPGRSDHCHAAGSCADHAVAAGALPIIEQRPEAPAAARIRAGRRRIGHRLQHGRGEVGWDHESSETLGRHSAPVVHQHGRHLDQLAEGRQWSAADSSVEAEAQAADADHKNRPVAVSGFRRRIDQSAEAMIEQGQLAGQDMPQSDDEVRIDRGIDEQVGHGRPGGGRGIIGVDVGRPILLGRVPGFPQTSGVNPDKPVVSGSQARGGCRKEPTKIRASFSLSHGVRRVNRNMENRE